MPESLEQRLIELKRQLVEINDPKSAGAILSLDQGSTCPVAERLRERDSAQG